MSCVITLPLPDTFQWPPLLAWVERHGPDWVNRVEGNTFARLFTVGSRRVLLRCGPEDGNMAVWLTTFDGLDPTAEVRAEAARVIRHMFALDLDWQAVRTALSADSVLVEPLAATPEFRPFRVASLFEALVDSIVGQQVNVSFALKLRHRLVEEFGASARVDGEVYYSYPTPSRFARASVSLLREMQLSERKAEYTLGVARRFERPFTLNGSPEADVERLMTLRGIGAWSAEYALMQGAGLLDLVPAGDVGLQAKLQRLHGLDCRPSEDAVRALAECWRPYRSLGAYFVWYAIPRSVA